MAVTCARAKKTSISESEMLRCSLCQLLGTEEILFSLVLGAYHSLLDIDLTVTLSVLNAVRLDYLSQPISHLASHRNGRPVLSAWGTPLQALGEKKTGKQHLSF